MKGRVFAVVTITGVPTAASCQVVRARKEDPDRVTITCPYCIVHMSMQEPLVSIILSATHLALQGPVAPISVIVNVGLVDKDRNGRNERPEMGARRRKGGKFSIFDDRCLSPWPKPGEGDCIQDMLRTVRGEKGLGQRRQRNVREGSNENYMGASPAICDPE